MNGTTGTLGIFFVVMVLTAGFVGAANEQTLGNADIIALTKLAIEEDALITKINTAKDVKFDTSTDDLIKLKESGVSGPVIAAMLKRSMSIILGTTPTIGSVTPKRNVSANSFPSNSWVLIPDGNKLIHLNGIAGYSDQPVGQILRAAFTFRSGSAICFKGIKAVTRLNASPTVIYSRHMPTESGVALVTVDEKENRRFVWIEGISVFSNKWEIFPAENDMKYDQEAMEGGVYKLTFKKPLPVGEYALLASDEKGNFLVYDFAVEKKEILNHSRTLTTTKEAITTKSTSEGEPPLVTASTQALAVAPVKPKMEKTEQPPVQAQAQAKSAKITEKPPVTFTLSAQYKGSKVFIDERKDIIYDRIISGVKKIEAMSVRKEVKEKGTIVISIAPAETKPLTINVIVSQSKADVKVDLLLVVNDSSTYTTDSVARDFLKIYNTCEP